MFKKKRMSFLFISFTLIKRSKSGNRGNAKMSLADPTPHAKLFMEHVKSWLRFKKVLKETSQSFMK